MITDADITTAANALFEAEQTGTQIGLLSVLHPDIDMDDAYKIQNAFTARKADAGQKIVGWKIGLTSKAMQNALNIDIPDSGVLFDNMVFQTGNTVPKGHFIQPRVEAEIAFVMKHDVNDASIETIIAATDYVTPSLEILDTRILRADPTTGQARRVFDTISDNAANAGIVLGAEKHTLGSIDLRWVGAILKRDDVVEETGLGAAVLDDPLLSMSWLVERLATYGQKIRAGDIVLSGSFIKIVEAPSGSKFHADFGSFGSVSIDFD